MIPTFEFFYTAHDIFSFNEYADPFTVAIGQKTHVTSQALAIP